MTTKAKANKPPAHGGTRPGAGRPAPNGRKSPISVRLTPDVLAFLEQQATGDVPQSNDSVSRSDLLDSAVRETPAFKMWRASQK